MNKKLSVALLSVAIGYSLLNPSYTSIVNAQTANEKSEQSINNTIPSEMVKITETPLFKEKIIANKSTQNIILADKNATEKTKELMAYLKDITQQNKVIFGHQNDVFTKVTPQQLNPSLQQNQNTILTESNVKDMTGSISGIFGLDTLAIAGCELGLSDPKAAINRSIEISLNAANQGAIITLSTHMPNFGSNKIKKLTDGSYDFTKCDFMDCKDLSGNVKDILPGGKNNEAFNAYIDMIGNFALKLQEKNIPILFRPFHENNGSWFWWGGDNISPKDSIKLYRYLADRLKSQGVHNLIYVYSPNGPVYDEKTYMSRYPGDEYIDILAIDYYDDYVTSPTKYREDFFNQLNSSCQIITKIAKEHNKLSAISESGTRVIKKDKSGYDGLLTSDNPIVGHDWFKRVGQIAIDNDMPYYLLWANYSQYNCYTPYKYNNEYGHELVNEFIDFYNWDNSIFANEVNYY